MKENKIDEVLILTVNAIWATPIYSTTPTGTFRNRVQLNKTGPHLNYISISI
jgi:hypothetical protein